jgi:hypothetical protein
VANGCQFDLRDFSCLVPAASGVYRDCLEQSLEGGLATPPREGSLGDVGPGASAASFSAWATLAKQEALCLK